MKNINGYVINFSLIIAILFASIISGDFYFSTILIISIPYCLFLLLYYSINLIKSKEFKLINFLFMSMTILSCVLFFFIGLKIYSNIDNEVHENCEFLMNKFKDGKKHKIFIEKYFFKKDYLIFENKNFIEIRSPGYSVIKINEISCSLNNS